MIYNYSYSDIRFWSYRPPVQSTDYFYKSKSTALKRSSLHQTKTFSCTVALDSIPSVVFLVCMRDLNRRGFSLSVQGTSFHCENKAIRSPGLNNVDRESVLFINTN